MLSRVKSITTLWLECELVDVEVDISRWLSSFSVVWLWDTAVQESKERVRSAIKNSNLNFPNIKIIVNLAPADLKKRWPSYDLAIALWILLSSWQISLPETFLKDTIFIWELALNWDLRHTTWILPIALYAKEIWMKRIIVPMINSKEAALIKWIEVWWIDNIDNLIKYSEWLKQIPVTQFSHKEGCSVDYNESLDFKYIKWQDFTKRALEISASWSHNILLNWSPWSWKTIMAKSLQTILPKMTLNESLEVTKIYSVSNKLKSSIVTQRPFRSIHHTASSVSIVWGWSNLKPWEISLAHRGILFLDEIAEFPSNVLEVLRQPLEDKHITISRASWSTTFPAQFTLVAAMNPCNCWYYKVPNSKKECTCTMQMINRYQKKISWPLIDRIDLYCDVPSVEYKEIQNTSHWESSDSIQKRVSKAKAIQVNRFKWLGITSNSEISHSDIDRYCKLCEKWEELLELSINKFTLSTRAIHKVLKVSRTIADINWNQDIKISDISEALLYRKKDL